MYAIVSTGGKQYKVKEGSRIKVESLGVEGKKVILKDVLMVWDNRKTEIGRPFLSGAKVICDIEKETKAPKVVVFKYKRRKGYKKKTGHRQRISALTVREIKLGNES